LASIARISGAAARAEINVTTEFFRNVAVTAVQLLVGQSAPTADGG